MGVHRPLCGVGIALDGLPDRRRRSTRSPAEFYEPGRDVTLGDWLCMASHPWKPPLRSVAR